jgi:hypothetical protein
MSKFNLKKFSQLEKEAMSFSPHQLPGRGKVGCGTNSFGLVNTDLENSKQLYKKETEHNDICLDQHQRDQGQSVCLHLSSEDSYSKPIKTNDQATLDRMCQEYAVRAAFCTASLVENTSVEYMQKYIYQYLKNKINNNPNINPLKQTEELNNLEYLNKIGLNSLKNTISTKEYDQISSMANKEYLLDKMLKTFEKDKSQRPPGFLKKIKEKHKEGDYNYLYNSLNKDQIEEIEPFTTTDPKKADPSRFTFDEKIFSNYLKNSKLPGFPESIKDLDLKLTNNMYPKSVEDEEFGNIIKDISYKDVYKMYSKFNIAGEDHPALGGKSEMKILQESIKATRKTIESGKDFFFKEYLLEKIKDKPEMQEFYNMVEELGLEIGNPSWYNIAWHSRGGSGQNAKMTREEILKTKDLKDISFYDHENDKKLYPGKSTTTNYPFTPHTALLENIGMTPYRLDKDQKEKIDNRIIARIMKDREDPMAGASKKDKINSFSEKEIERYEKLTKKAIETKAKQHNKKIESINDDINEIEKQKESAKSKGQDTEKLQKKLDQLKYRKDLAKKIRENIATIGHNEENSFFKMYDDICEEYLNYTVERYGPAPFFRYSTISYDDKDPNKITLEKPHYPQTQKTSEPGYLKGRHKNIFKPQPKSEGLIEITISLEYANTSSPLTPQLAKTNLSKMDANIFGDDKVEEIKQRMRESGVKKFTLSNGKYTEVEIDESNIDDFFDKIRNNKVLVYRASPPDENGSYGKYGDYGNVNFYMGKNSYKAKHTDRQSKRVIQDPDGSTRMVSGRGEPRISQGKRGTYASLTSPPEKKEDVSTGASFGFEKETMQKADNINDLIASAGNKYHLSKELMQQMTDKFPKYLNPLEYDIQIASEKMQKEESLGHIIISPGEQDKIIRAIHSSGVSVEGLLPKDDEDFGKEEELIKEANTNIEKHKKDEEEADEESSEVADEESSEVAEKEDKFSHEAYAKQIENLLKEHGKLLGEWFDDNSISYMRGQDYKFDNNDVIDIPDKYKEAEEEIQIDQEEELAHKEYADQIKDLLKEHGKLLGEWFDDNSISYMHDQDYKFDNNDVIDIPDKYKEAVEEEQENWETVKEKQKDKVEELVNTNEEADQIDIKEVPQKQKADNKLSKADQTIISSFDNFLYDKYWAQGLDNTYSQIPIEETMVNIENSTEAYIDEFITSQKFKDTPKNKKKIENIRNIISAEVPNILNKFKNDFVSKTQHTPVDEKIINFMTSYVEPILKQGIQQNFNNGIDEDEVSATDYTYAYFTFLMENKLALSVDNSKLLFNKFQELFDGYKEDIYDTIETQTSNLSLTDIKDTQQMNQQLNQVERDVNQQKRQTQQDFSYIADDDDDDFF